MIDITRRTFTASVIGALAWRAQAPGDLAALTSAEASGQMRAGTVTATQLTEACLARIDVYNPKLNCFITVLREQALAQARALDAEQRRGRLRGPLHGIPIALKDNIDTAGVRTTAASPVFDDRVPDAAPEGTPRFRPPAACHTRKTTFHDLPLTHP